MKKESEVAILRVRGGQGVVTSDWVAAERPLEILVRAAGEECVLSTTMRTPGEDRALAVGFLFGERVIENPNDLLVAESVDDNTVRLQLAPRAQAALEAARRPFVTTGACGVCGRTDLDALLASVSPGDHRAATLPRAKVTIAAAVVHALPTLLRQAQATFSRTGGLHAAGFFAPDGQARLVLEDVGRHNAVDKLVGTEILGGCLPEPDTVLVVSGRASFELVQKAAVAGISIMAAVGAPSSLAVEIARGAGMTLLGFVRNGGFNVYCGAERLSGVSTQGAGVESTRDALASWA